MNTLVSQPFAAPRRLDAYAHTREFPLRVSALGEGPLSRWPCSELHSGEHIGVNIANKQ